MIEKVTIWIRPNFSFKGVLVLLVYKNGIIQYLVMLHCIVYKITIYNDKEGKHT